MPLDLPALHASYFPLIREKCRRSLSDRAEAEDVAQETFIRLVDFRTSTRLTVDRFRSRKTRIALHEVAARKGDEASQAQPNRDREIQEQLERIAWRIPKDELEVLVLHRFDRLSQP